MTGLQMNIAYEITSTDSSRNSIEVEYTLGSVKATITIRIKEEDLVGDSATVESNIVSAIERSAPLRLLEPREPEPTYDIQFDLDSVLGTASEVSVEQHEDALAMLRYANDPEGLRIYNLRKAYNAIPDGTSSEEKSRIVRDIVQNSRSGAGP